MVSLLTWKSIGMNGWILLIASVFQTVSTGNGTTWCLPTRDSMPNCVCGKVRCSMRPIKMLHRIIKRLLTCFSLHSANKSMSLPIQGPMSIGCLLLPHQDTIARYGTIHSLILMRQCQPSSTTTPTTRPTRSSSTSPMSIPTNICSDHRPKPKSISSAPLSTRALLPTILGISASSALRQDRTISPNIDPWAVRQGSMPIRTTAIFMSIGLHNIT